MSSLNNAELLIITIILSLFFISCMVIAVQLIRVLSKIRRLSAKAEAVIDSVESAAETIKNFSAATNQRFPLLHLIHSFFEMSNKNKSK